MGLNDEWRDWKMGAPLWAESGRLYRRRLAHIAPISQPLILVSQVQRSGGTLLSQLFDGHPQCHAHPHELHIGHPKKYDWPQLDLRDKPQHWFALLKSKDARRAFRKGYQKYSTGAEGKGEQFPFLLPPRLQKLVFLDCVENKRIEKSRDILDCYLTSFFNAWLDNHNLYGAEKKIVTAFAADLSLKESNIAGFMRDYPDGKFISLVRDPRSWYASARKHKDIFGDIEKATALWRHSTQSALSTYEKYPGRVHLLSFEDLVSDTPGTMRVLAAAIGIDFLPQLLTPTFNGFSIKADSSYKVQDYGVIQEPLTRYKKVLSGEDISYIESQAQELFEKAQSLKLTPAVAP